MKSEKAELIIVYGKRRVGKTELLNQLNITYIMFRQESEKNQLKRVSDILAEKNRDDFLSVNPFSNWDAFFKYIEDRDLKIIFDEFPYAVASNHSLPSILQDYWDRKLRHTRTKLILCGSSITMMESLLGYKSPIYGRRTAQMMIEPMHFREASMFYEKAEDVHKVETYAILGGTPAYILEFNHKLPIRKNLMENVLQKDAFLFNEVGFILREELKEPRTYFSILSAIALGKTKIGEIMNHTGYSKGTVTSYLAILNDLHLIKRKVPVTEKSPMNSRKGIYVLKDHFFRFWFRYIFQNMEYFSLNRTDELQQKILDDMPNYVSYAFEEICIEFISHKLRKYILVGSWWDKGEEIDLVAINEGEKTILFGECKWTNKPVGINVYNMLREKSPLVKWHNDERKEHYAIFAKAGFTEELKKKAKEENIILYTLKDILKGQISIN